jgi:hypothetical protein
MQGSLRIDASNQTTLQNRRVLANGYAPAHTALACHRIRPAGDPVTNSSSSRIGAAVARLRSRGFALSEGWAGVQIGSSSSSSSSTSSTSSSGSSSSGGGDSAVAASADGLLLQAATVADLVECWFAGESEVSGKQGLSPAAWRVLAVGGEGGSVGGGLAIWYHHGLLFVSSSSARA